MVVALELQQLKYFKTIGEIGKISYFGISAIIVGS